MATQQTHAQQDVFMYSYPDDFVIVTSVKFSAIVGWMPIELSNCGLVRPILTATAKPCMT